MRAAALIPDSTVRVFANCGHGPPRERPDSFVRAVREFLSDGADESDDAG